MRATQSLAFLAALIAASESISAAGPPGRSNPYVNLFTGLAQAGRASPALPSKPEAPVAPVMRELVARAATLAKAERRVVCGMTVVQGDSTVDAHILLAVPQLNGKPAIRTVHPRACRQ